MKLEELIAEWETDSKIDRYNLVGESLNTPKLHAKYYRIYLGEKARLIKWLNDVKQLKLDKYEFYVDGPHSETPPEWELPAKGRVIKADVDRYLDADRELIALCEKVDLQKEKIKMIEDIIYSLRTRNYIIKNAIDMIKFESGG